MGFKARKIGTKQNKKGKYNKYSFEERRMLITMVSEEGRTLASSAKELGICQTTARLIMSTWKEEGRVFQKKSERAKRQRREHKKRAQEKRRERSERQREDEIAQGEVQNMMSSLKIEENEVASSYVSVGVEDAHPQVTENPLQSPAQVLQQPILYQMVLYEGRYYLQQVFNLPLFPSLI